MDHFFTPLGDGTYRSTGLTRGPWDPDHQHFGPPAALLGRTLAAVEGGEDKRIARISFELLGPVPIADLHVEADLVRPGRRVDLVEARLAGPTGALLALARAWRMRVGEVDLAEVHPGPAVPPMPGPDEATLTGYSLESGLPGYHTATQWRFLDGGGFAVPGPARAWCRLEVEVVAGEPPTPLERVLVAADSGNGISTPGNMDELLFVNTELTVHLHRDPVGEWVGMDAATVLEPTGTGLSSSMLRDVAGPIGRGNQALLVDRRR